MSDPKTLVQERDELDLDAETVTDLDFDESSAENVAGGRNNPTTSLPGHQG